MALYRYVGLMDGVLKTFLDGVKIMLKCIERFFY